MSLILLTNDDGIDADGLQCLEAAVRDLADVIVVAPDRERSAVSHGLTLHSPLTLNRIDDTHYTLNGTPADCVIYALTHLTNPPPDLVLSGINHGANLGDDIMYSGTVAGAREANRHGIASIAFSQAYDEKPIRFKEGTRFIHNIVKVILEQKPRGSVCLNVNIPVRRIKGVKITRQGCSAHHPFMDSLERISDPENAPEIAEHKRKSSLTLDFHAILDHYVSVTPLQRDQTDYLVAQSMSRDVSKLFQGSRIPGLGLIGLKN